MIELQTFLNDELRSDRLVFKVGDVSMASKIAEYYIRNEQHFSMSMADFGEYFFEEKFHIERIWQEFDEMVSNNSIRFYLFDINDYLFSKIIGDISINSIFSNGPKSCILGYKVDKENCNQGFASESIERIIDFLFEELELHRITLYIYKKNYTSIKLAEKFNFIKEGKLKNYLKIDNKWSEFLQYSLINQEN